MLTLSSAALGLSLVFIKDVVDLSNAMLIWAIVLSWALFGVAIISTMASFISSRMAMEAQDDLARRGLLDGDSGVLDQIPTATTWTGRLNWVSAGAFATSIILTIFFVTMNILGGE